MKALQLVAWQHAPELREVADPEPGPGEVVVRIAGAGACHSDLHLMADFPPGMLPFEPPFTLGHENAGWVHALGAGVTGLEIGQPVAVYGAWGCGSCRRCRQGMENYCERQAEIGVMGGGLGADGGMAPFMRVPSARFLVPIGDLDPVDAAPLTDAGLTPYHAVKRSLPLLIPGSHAVVIGAGGLGHIAVQLLRELSAATVIAVDQRTEPLELCAQVGADHTVTSGVEGHDTAAEIRELTGGKGADVVIDCVGVNVTMALGAAVGRPLGHLTVVGLGGGTLPFTFFALPYEMSVAATYWGTLPELVELIELAVRGRVRAHVQRFDLDHAAQVYDDLKAGRLRGRAVVVPSA